MSHEVTSFTVDIDFQQFRSNPVGFGGKKCLLYVVEESIHLYVIT